jgi:broad specificity phosphatase PhoE
MSRLILVRHGQASFLADDYDQLSPTGHAQSERLGQYWSSRDQVFDLVVHGPGKRHIQTGSLVAGVYRKAGLAWPEPAAVSDFDEYQAFELLRKALPLLIERDAGIRALEHDFRSKTDPLEAARAFELVFQRVTRMWAAGEIDADGVEPWEDFCARVTRGLKQVTKMAGKSATVGVFTSGGPIATAVRLALGISAVKTLELSWASRNASYSEFLFSDTKFSLSSFNVHPHLEDADVLTYR